MTQAHWNYCEEVVIMTKNCKKEVMAGAKNCLHHIFLQIGVIANIHTLEEWCGNNVNSPKFDGILRTLYFSKLLGMIWRDPVVSQLLIANRKSLNGLWSVSWLCNKSLKCCMSANLTDACRIICVTHQPITMSRCLPLLFAASFIAYKVFCLQVEHHQS